MRAIRERRPTHQVARSLPIVLAALLQQAGPQLEQAVRHAGEDGRAQHGTQLRVAYLAAEGEVAPGGPMWWGWGAGGGPARRQRWARRPAPPRQQAGAPQRGGTTGAAAPQSPPRGTHAQSLADTSRRPGIRPAAQGASGSARAAGPAGASVSRRAGSGSARCRCRPEQGRQAQLGGHLSATPHSLGRPALRPTPHTHHHHRHHHTHTPPRAGGGRSTHLRSASPRPQPGRGTPGAAQRACRATG